MRKLPSADVGFSIGKLKRNCGRSLLLLLIGLIAPAVSFAQSRPPATPAEPVGQVALVIGNAIYPDSDETLRHPVKDARMLAEELRRRSFDVAPVGENLTKEAMLLAIHRLYERIQPGSVALIYFSGYGIQTKESQSYLIPVNAQIWSEADVRRDGINVQWILSEMSDRGAGLKVIIVDASRRTPWERRFRKMSLGLAAATGSKGSLIMYSAAPNTVVQDSDGENSLFMRELLREINTPGLTVEQAFHATRSRVFRASKGEQLPWVSSFVVDEVYINPPKPARQAAPSPPGPKEPPAQTSSADPCAAAPAHWQSAEAMGSKAAFEDHLKWFANCPFAGLARLRIEALAKPAAQAPAETRTQADPQAPAKPDGTQHVAADPAPPDVRNPPSRPPTRSASTCSAPVPDNVQAGIPLGGDYAAPITVRPNLSNAKPLRTVVFSPDQTKFATGGDDGTIRVWDAASFKLIRSLQGDREAVYSIAFWTDGSLLASASINGTVRVWDLSDGRAIHTFKAETESDRKALRQFAVAFYPGRALHYVDSAGDDGLVWIWDLQQNKLARTKLGHKAVTDPTIRSLSFAPNVSGEFVTAGFDGTIRFYNVGKNDPDAVEAHSGKVLGVAYSPDGTRVVSAGVDKGLKNLKVWNAKKQTVVRTYQGHTDYVVAVAWSSDGKRLVSGGGGKDKTARLWDADSGKQLQTFVGHREDVEAVAFHPTRNWLVSVSEDRMLKLWDIGSAKELMTIVPFTDGGYLAYTPLGCYMGSDGVERHFKLVVDGVAKDVSPDLRRTFFSPNGLTPLLAGAAR